MKVNEGSFDRAARMIIGIQLMALGLSGTIRGAGGVIATVIGGVALLTGAIGYCPLYRWLDWSTVSKRP